MPQKKPKKPPNQPHTFQIQMNKSAFSPAHKNIRMHPEDSNTLPPLIAKVRAASHGAPRPRKADVVRISGQSQADKQNRLVRCLKDLEVPETTVSNQKSTEKQKRS